MKEKVAAIMPMKGHSSRVPGKNIRDLCGKPMFHWVVEALLDAQDVSRVIINTDSDVILQDISKSYSTSRVCAFKRPEYLLGDFVSMNALIKHDMDVAGGEHFLQTHATNPLLTPETIGKAIDEYFSSLPEYDSLFSVNRIQSRVYDRFGTPINYDPENPMHIHTQNIDPLFEENSNLFLLSRSGFYRNQERRLGVKPKMFEMDPLEAVDVDVEDDFIMAEMLMQRRIKENAG